MVKLYSYLVRVEVVGWVCVFPLARLSCDGLLPDCDVDEVLAADDDDDADVVAGVGGGPPIMLLSTPSIICWKKTEWNSNKCLHHCRCYLSNLIIEKNHTAYM